MSWDYMNEQLHCGLRIRYAWAVLPFRYLSTLISWHVDVLQTLQKLRKGGIDAGGAELTGHEFLYFLQGGQRCQQLVLSGFSSVLRLSTNLSHYLFTLGASLCSTVSWCELKTSNFPALKDIVPNLFLA